MSDFGPSHAVIGDNANYGLDLEARQTDTTEISEAAKLARFSKTAEFKALKEKLESRIYYYQHFQPSAAGGDIAIRDLPNDERGWRWLAADLIISEFQAVIAAYELANETIKSELAKQKAA